eukprot:TCALIF_02290-PA protein Name:"Similar to 4cl2 Probable 4-coumarate--CoA ligase 2 (Dictyostelium discoideum)" AED:0.08 eAED:0.08 QI:10/0.81/0.83/0.91/0.90/0.83/12/272/929
MMRNLSTPYSAMNRRGSSSSGIGASGPPPLASSQQARYKGLLSTPGMVKFSAWKRETDIPRTDPMMRNLSTPYSAMNRRGSSSSGIGASGPPPLASSQQARYKGLLSTPGMVKFSAWKRETDIPRLYFHDFLLAKIKEKDPNKVWLKDVSLGRTETYGRVAGSVSKIASGLTKLGFGKRDVVCMCCSNYVEYWLLALAAWKCGGCVMPVNCEIDMDVLEEQLTEAKPKIVVCDDFNYEDILDVVDGNELIKHVIVIGSEGKAQGCIPVNDLFEDDEKTPPPRLDLSLDNDTVYLPFTSASSGYSAGIMHTHKSLMSWFYSPDGAANHYLDQMMGENIACGNWFFHLSGFYTVALAAIYGVSVFTLSEYSDTGFFDLIIRLLSQSKSITKYDMSCLKSITTSGGVLSSTIRIELLERFPNVKYVREAYGLNECGLVTLTYPREKKNSVTTAKALETPNDHVMPVGLPNMYTQIKIISRQSNENVGGHDEQGEICIKSPQTFVGYLNEDNKHLLDAEGFFHTGDLGYYDSQGVIYYVEKIENLIHFWMYEVAPNILESRLLGSSNIVDAAVVGIPNKENGEVPRAFVVLRPGFEETEENLTNLIESRLQDHERIRGGLYFIQNIPRDENWKVMKDVLKNYEPLSMEELNKQTESEWNIPADDQSVTPSKVSSSLGKSPKTAKKVVKQLEKQPNGSFMASPEEECPSPRTKRSAKKISLEVPNDPQDIFGMRNRSRRGSMDCILEDKPSAGAVGGAWKGPQAASTTGTAGGKRRPSESRRVSGGAVRAGGSRRGSNADLPVTPLSGSAATDAAGNISYWMKVFVHPQTLEQVVMSHPAVDDCSVQAFHVDGIGDLPRAFVVLKTGYEATAEEILQFAHSRLAHTDHLRGGIVFAEKLPKDGSGKLMCNVDKLSQDAIAVDTQFIKQQPKVKL